MARILRLPDGRLLLAGGKFINAAPGAPSGGGTVDPPPADDTPLPGMPLTALTVRDYYAKYPEAEPVYQRKAGFDYVDMPVMFDFTGPSAANVQARVVVKDTGAVVGSGWTTLQNISVAGSVGLGLLPGVPIGAGYIIQIRDGAQHSTTSTGTQKWGVGIVWLCFGQSNMLGTLVAGYGGTIVPGTTRTEWQYWSDKVYPTSFFTMYGFTSVNAPDGWSNATGGGGACAFLRIVAKTLEAKYGKKIPVALVPWARSSTGIATYFAETGSFFVGSGTTDGTIGMQSPRNYAPGDFEGASFHQGENDAADSLAKRVADLKTLYQGMLNHVAPYGRTAANLPLLMAVLGTYDSFPGIETIRAAAYQLTAEAPGLGWPKVRTSWNCIDLNASDPNDPQRDNQHFNDISGGKQNRRMSVMRMIHDVCHEIAPEIVSTNAQGPRLAGTATRNGLTITLPIVKTPGATLSTENGGAPSGFSVNTAADFSGAAIACTAALSGDNVVLTLAAGITGTVYVKHCGGKVGTSASNHPDISNLIGDDMRYPTGAHTDDQFTSFKLQPTPTAITVN